MQIITGIIIGVIMLCVGTFFGIFLMCLFQVGKKEAATTIKTFEKSMEHERVVAIKEKRSSDYINGISSMIALFRLYYEEELEK